MLITTNYNADYNQILQSDRDHLLRFVGGLNTRKQIQDGRRPLSWKIDKWSIGTKFGTRHTSSHVTNCISVSQLLSALKVLDDNRTL